MTESETKKEHNRRLLLHHQETYGCPDNGRNFKRKSNSFRHVKRLQDIKEEDTRDAKYRYKREVSLRTSANKSEEEERNSDNIWQHVTQVFKRKEKILKKKKRQTQNKIKNISPPVDRIKCIYLSEALRIFKNDISLYSSSAFRYAMLRSNRRYKTGDEGYNEF